MSDQIIKLGDKYKEKAYEDTVDNFSYAKFNYDLEYDIRTREVRRFIDDVYDFYVYDKCVYKFNEYYDVYIRNILYSAHQAKQKPIITKDYLIDGILENQFLLRPNLFEAEGIIPKPIFQQKIKKITEKEW